MMSSIILLTIWESIRWPSTETSSYSRGAMWGSSRGAAEAYAVAAPDYAVGS
jgi:hypothetical protein